MLPEEVEKSHELSERVDVDSKDFTDSDKLSVLYVVCPLLNVNQSPSKKRCRNPLSEDNFCDSWTIVKTEALRKGI